MQRLHRSKHFTVKVIYRLSSVIWILQTCLSVIPVVQPVKHFNHDLASDIGNHYFAMKPTRPLLH